MTTAAVLGLLAVTAPATGRAQDTSSTAKTATNAPVSPPPPAMSEVTATPALFHPFTLGIEAGTTGVGIAGDWRFMNHLGVGAAFDYLPINYNGKIQGNNYDARLRLMSEPVTLNVYPWKNNTFHLSLGALFNENHLTGTTSGSITLNGTSYSGTADLDIKQQLVNPYGTIGGKLYFGSGRRVSLGLDLGAMYTGDPRVTLTAHTIPPAAAADVQAEQQKIKHYAKDAEVWPVLKLSLNFSF